MKCKNILILSEEFQIYSEYHINTEKIDSGKREIDKILCEN